MFIVAYIQLSRQQPTTTARFLLVLEATYLNKMLYTLSAQFGNQPARTYKNTRHLVSPIETMGMKTEECRGQVEEVCTFCAKG
jgi:hypothetical protein